MARDLTEGKPSKVILTFALPLLLSTAIQQLYNIADSAVIGRLDSADSLACIGAAYPITLFFVAIATGSCMGCSVIIAQLFGAKKTREVKSGVYTALIALSVFGAVFALAGFFLAGPLMKLLGCHPDAFDGARTYLSIYAIGVFPMLAYNAANASFTGLGDARHPLYFLIISSVLNIILDIIAVGPMRLGVMGAAWATTISQFVAAIISAAVILRKIEEIKTEEKVPAFDKEILKRMTRMAVPSILQQSTIALGHTFLQMIVNTFGPSAMAGYEIGAKIVNFLYMCFNTIGTALSSFAGQNFGAKMYDRIRSGYRAANMICITYAVAVVATVQIIPYQLVGIFVNSTDTNAAEITSVAVSYLRIVSIVFLIIAFIIPAGGLLRGLGEINKFFAATVIDIILRVGVSCLLSFVVLHSITGIYYSWFVGSSVDLILLLICYRRMCRFGMLKNGSAGKGL